MGWIGVIEVGYAILLQNNYLQSEINVKIYRGIDNILLLCSRLTKRRNDYILRYIATYICTYARMVTYLLKVMIMHNLVISNIRMRSLSRNSRPLNWRHPARYGLCHNIFEYSPTSHPSISSVAQYICYICLYIGRLLQLRKIPTVFCTTINLRND